MHIVKLFLIVCCINMNTTIFAQKNIKSPIESINFNTNEIDTNKTVQVVYPPLTEREGKGLTIPIPPNEHPRLLFRKKDIPKLLEKAINPLLLECWKKIVESSELDTDGKLIQNGKPNIELKILSSIESNALLYALRKNKEAGNKAVRAILNFNNTLQFNYKREDNCRDIGRVIYSNALVYDWCYDLISDQEKKNLISFMETLATKLEVVWPYLKQGSIVGHGTEAQLSRDMLSCGIATYNEKPEIYNLVAGRIFSEFLPSRHFFYPASYHHQGSAYGPVRFMWDMYLTFLFDKMGYPNVVDKNQATLPYRWIYTRRPDGQFLRDGDDFNDNYYNVGQYWNIFGVGLAASYYKDPILMGETIKEKQIGTDFLFDFLTINPSVYASDDLSYLPLTRYFNEPLGSMVARTGWSDEISSNTVVAEMKVGVYNFANHQHLDAGNFQIYYKGPLAINSGIYQGVNGSYGSEHFVNYYQRSISHNTMLVNNPNEVFLWHGRTIVNDGGQKYPNNADEPMNMQELLTKGYKTGEVLEHDFGPDAVKPEYTYIKGELAEAYSDKVKSYKRSFVFLNLKNKFVPAALIVFDRVESSNKDFKKTWLLHCVQEPEIKKNISTIIRNEKGYNGQLVNTTLLPEEDNLIINKIGGEENAYSVNGKNYPQGAIRQNCSNDNAMWRLEISPKSCSKVDNFLNVMQVMDYSANESKALVVEKIEIKKLVGTKIGDRMVLFSKNGDLISEPIELELLGSSTSKVFIADLIAGNWKVKRIDKTNSLVITVTDNKNLLYFNGDKGTWLITKE